MNGLIYRYWLERTNLWPYMSMYNSLHGRCPLGFHLAKCAAFNKDSVVSFPKLAEPGHRNIVHVPQVNLSHGLLVRETKKAEGLELHEFTRTGHVCLLPNACMFGRTWFKSLIALYYLEVRMQRKKADVKEGLTSAFLLCIELPFLTDHGFHIWSIGC